MTNSTHLAVAPADKPRSDLLWFRRYILFAVVCGLAVAAAGTHPAGSMITLLLGVSAAVAVVAGCRINKTSNTTAWHLLATAVTLSVVTAVLRAALPEESLIVHISGFGAYGLLTASVVAMLRQRRGPGHPGAVLDGVLVGLAAAALGWSVFVVPAVTSEHSGMCMTIIKTAYPVASVVTVFLLSQLALTGLMRTTAFRLMAAAGTAVLVADICFAMNDAGYSDIPLAAIDLGYLLVAVLVALAALHPTMRGITEPVVMNATKLSTTRAAVLTISLATPILLMAFWASSTTAQRIPVAVLGLGIVLVVMLRVTEAVRQYAQSEQRLAHAATHDSLTELPNRTHLLDTLDNLLGDGGRSTNGVALLFCDLDRFKYVNDTWGHGIGDQLLELVAARLSAAGTKIGATVARIGGDEFVVLCDGVADTDEARRLARQVLAEFDEPFELTVGSYHITPSIGVAFCAQGDRTTGADMIRNADTAMYVAKQSDEHISLFDTSMQEQAARRLELENDLHGAAARGELVVHFQPVVEVDTGAIASFEALVRWQHPTRGMVPPLEFIPVAEETGTIIEIGDFVMEQSIAALGRWWAADPERCPQIAVNASGRQLRDTNFADHVEELLATHGVPAHRLCVEITETVILDGSAATMEQLNRLADLGCSIAADDFGTGYSSLSYLKKYPVDRVKIDREFVWGLDAEGGPRPDDEAIVDAVLAMASALGLGVVAEGVETEEQRAHLSERGCRWAQGWLFGKPLPIVEAEALLGRTLPVS